MRLNETPRPFKTYIPPAVEVAAEPVSKSADGEPETPTAEIAVPPPNDGAESSAADVVPEVGPEPGEAPQIAETSSAAAELPNPAADRESAEGPKADQPTGERKSRRKRSRGRRRRRRRKSSGS